MLAGHARSDFCSGGHRPPLQLNSRKQRHWFADNMSVRQFPPLCVCKREPLFLSAQLHLPVQLIENFMRCFRQYRRNEDCDNAQRLYYLVENFGEMRGFVLLFSEQPGLCRFYEHIARRSENMDLSKSL